MCVWCNSAIQGLNRNPDAWGLTGYKDGYFWFEDIKHTGDEKHFPIKCKPRYQVGETVYIKEAWATYRANDDWSIAQIAETATIFYEGEIGEYGYVGKCRSPLMMPARFAHHFITITGVRAERLQEITWEDVLKEGIGHTIAISQPKWMVIDLFKVTWNSINKDYPWESNPWVFLYEFELLRNN